MKTIWTTISFLSMLTAAVPFTANASSETTPNSYDAVALDDEDDDLDDILNSDDGTEDSVKEEKDAVKEGNVDDQVGTRSNNVLGEEISKRKRLPIKVLQRKKFLKVGRFEVGPHLGFVTNDPFINRYMVGASFAYHITEIFAAELTGTFAPDFGKGDWKPITTQLVNQNKVSPDISKIIWTTAVNFQFSPIYGKLALSKGTINFDVFGVFGMGVVGTNDDLLALQCDDDPQCIDSEVQTHPTSNIGGGFRVIFSKNLALRLEGRSLIYIETINSTTLEMKNNFILAASATFFFPGMK